MNTRLLIPLLLAGAVALACGTRSHSDAAVSPSGKSTRMVAKKGDAHIASAFTVQAEPKGLSFALELTNASKKSVELEFPSGQEYDFSIVDSTGHEVYSWGKGRMFTQSLQNRLIDSGETMRFSGSTDKTLPGGSYVAVATLRSSNYPLQERVAFQLR
jgi:hypothetical protein